MFKRILIANRGEIALRIIRCCREMDVETVIVYSTADKDSLAVMAADKAVCIGPAKAVESYLNQDAIIETAILTGCEAVHPGYGFLSENSEVVRRCKENGIAFIGPDASTTAIALDEVCKEYGIPHITTCGTNYKVTQREEDGSVRENAFRICLSDPQLGDIMAGYAVDKLGYKKVAILYEITSEYSLGITNNFTDALEAKGGKVTICEAYKSGDVDFRAQLSKIKEFGDYDALMIPANYKEVGLITKQARSMGIEVPFLGVDAWNMRDLFEIAGDEVQGSVFPGAMDVNAPELQSFKEAFKERWDLDPDGAGTDSYLAHDCFDLLKWSIEKAGEATPEKIREAMENATEVPCLTSVISIDPETHNPLRNATIYQVQGDEFVKIDEYSLND